MKPRVKEPAIDGKLQIRNVPTDMTNAELSDLFTRCGEVMEARIVRDATSGQSKGYGFVTMSALSEADTAVSRLDGHAVRGCLIQVRLARARTMRGSEPTKRRSPREGQQ